MQLECFVISGVKKNHTFDTSNKAVHMLCNHFCGSLSLCNIVIIYSGDLPEYFVFVFVSVLVFVFVFVSVVMMNIW